MLGEILHNIGDHAKALLRMLQEPGLNEEFATRMYEHINLEEKENTEKLILISKDNSNALVRKLLDHSFFIQKMIEDDSIPLDLKIELLDHFMEEHAEWERDFKRDGQSTSWTVGPIWNQGGY